jgi:tRNA modification GTPase
LSSDLVGGADTIIARATPAGRGALAMIRVSGPETPVMAAAVCRGVSFGEGWKASLTTVRDARGDSLERAVAITYPAPRSYTGEDMLELTVHGSPFLVEAVIEAFLAAGARPAAAGEFTRRAVANGKLDLVQAEAVADLVAADTAWQHRNAREQLAGELSDRLRSLRSSLVSALGIAEAAVDYGAQGVEVSTGELAAPLEECRSRVNELLATAGAGARIRDGLRLVILGPPNAGKSTLFNTLCGAERAIVSPHPGTTRDVIEAELDIGGIRIIVQDTAGLRTDGDEVEIEGHRRARAAAASADIAVFLWPMVGGEDPEVSGVPDGQPVVLVRSKSDLSAGDVPDDGWLRLSCRTGEGLAELRDELVRRVLGDVPDLGGAVAIASRHRRALEEASGELQACHPDSPETAAEGLRWALRAIDELVGAVSNEEVLDEIFAAFCIGK